MLSFTSVTMMLSAFLATVSIPVVVAGLGPACCWSCRASGNGLLSG
mgnify:CR=1 FL=1